jgi:multidrug efflux system membrane fusion protein
VDAQAALVRQLQGTIEADRAQVENAQLQLDFTRITAPIAGRLGLRQVDVGNMIHAGDPTGLVIITQTQPITAVFAVPGDQTSIVLPAWQKGAPLPVEAYDRDGKKRLSVGKLGSIDNQIDVNTGTVKLKAVFANEDDALFPNQFINVRLKIGTLPGATLIPTAAIQRGTPGTFVYVVGEDNSVLLRKVKVGPTSNEWVAIPEGLDPDERVVIDGADDLRDGSRVEVIGERPQPGAGAGPGMRKRS